MMSTQNKDSLLSELKSIINIWHIGTRPGNDGNAGNTLEDLLGVSENNLSLPDYGDIELKTQKYETGSLITLFHNEPKPPRSVPNLLKALGWSHQEAGKMYSHKEMSFRSTTYGHRFSVRGFTLTVQNNRVEFIFDPNQVKKNQLDSRGTYSTYGDWLSDVNSRTKPNYKDILPVYYDLDQLTNKFVNKLDHTLFALCKTKTVSGVKQFRYEEIYLLKDLKTSMIPSLFMTGDLILDFDARTGHNHGTKFRISKNKLTDLFINSERVF